MARSPARVNVLWISHTAKLGGAEMALIQTIQNLDSERFSVSVLLFSDGPLRARLEQAGIPTHVQPLPNYLVNASLNSFGLSAFFRVSDNLIIASYVIWLAFFLTRRHIGIVHTNSLKAHLIGGLAARLVDIPVVWHMRNRFHADYIPASLLRLLTRLCRLVPSHVISVSNDVRSQVDLACGPVVAEHSSTIYDGIDCTRFHRSSPRLSSRGGPRIGLLGRISPFKGQHVFLQAASRVLEKHPTARFTMVGAALFGEEDYEDQLRELTASLGIAQQVCFAGFRDDIPQVLAELDVLVHASIQGEPFGQVIVEAMAAGKPVIATLGGGVPEIVEHEKTGLLVPMNDPDTMAQAICRLLENPQAAAEMGRCGARRARELFPICNTANGVQDVYQQLLENHARKRAHRRLWPLLVLVGFLCVMFYVVHFFATEHAS